MSILVNDLKAMQLDAWVAKALGHDVLGQAWASYDPETGKPEIEMEQKALKRSKDAHLRFFAVDECHCDIYNQTQEEINEVNKKHGYNPDPDVIVLGHNWLCLQPVPNYSSLFEYGMPIISKERIALTPYGDKQWKAEKSNLSIIADTQLEAGLKLFITLSFGERVDDSIINL